MILPIFFPQVAQIISLSLLSSLIMVVVGRYLGFVAQRVFIVSFCSYIVYFVLFLLF